MPSHAGASVKQLARESERSREAFVETVGQLKGEVSDTIEDLKDRLSPANVKAEIKAYVREESSELVSAIERKARENPLQAVAVGAALAYPLWSVLRTVPVPVLLIGGGFLLSRQGTGKIHGAISEGTGEIAKTARDLQNSASEGMEAVNNTIHDVSDRIVNTAETAAAAIKAEAAEVAEKVSETAAELGQAGSQAVKKTRTIFDEVIESNPLLVGGIALAVGAFVAASLPGTQVEDKLFGERSDEIKEKAAQAVSEGVERAKDTAADVVGDISAAAARQGLNSEGLSKSIEGATAAVKAVVDRGLNTALGGGDGDSPAQQYHN